MNEKQQHATTCNMNEQQKQKQQLATTCNMNEKQQLAMTTRMNNNWPRNIT